MMDLNPKKAAAAFHDAMREGGPEREFLARMARERADREGLDAYDRVILRPESVRQERVANLVARVRHAIWKVWDARPGREGRRIRRLMQIQLMERAYRAQSRRYWFGEDATGGPVLDFKENTGQPPREGLNAPQGASDSP